MIDIYSLINFLLLIVDLFLATIAYMLYKDLRS